MPEIEDSTLGLPLRFGKYTLIRKLAQGGMAELFLAIQRSSVAGFEKLIVIKRILPEVSQDKAFIDMLLHEARVAATLSHPSIVQTFDVGQVDGRYFIAMEHVHGEDLRNIVRQMKNKGVLEFPVEHALGVILGMCAGLAYAHERHDLDGSPLHIVHRDISPQNVVVTFAGDVKIVDFGIAKSDTKHLDHTKSGKLKGKVPYMSPEQARGDHIDARSDIFSTGTMLFELTTGKRLFKGPSEYETLKLICEQEYPRPSQVRPDYPPDLEAIVMKALAKNPDDRYPTARAMQADLEDFVRRHQIPVSSVALHQFMQSLFADKLTAQKEALSQGKQLADIIDAQHPRNPESTHEFEALGSGPRAITQSTPAAAQTVTDGSTLRPKGPWLLVAMSLGVIALAGTGAYGIARALKSPPPAPTSAAATRGTVRVTSAPAGASIWVNGDLRPEVTPATLELPRGAEIDLKLTMEGFEHAKQRFNLSEISPSMDISLELKRGSVVVDVAVLPAHAKPSLSLDGTPVQGTTIEGVTSGTEHKLTISAPGFTEQTLTFIGNPLDRKHLDVTLEKVPAHDGKPHGGAVASGKPGAATPPAVPAGNGKLSVGASGGWCNVTVDGQGRGATPVAGLELSAGSHKVTCTTADGKVQSAVVSVPADGVARYKFTL